jgi:hypothetical protein
MRAQTKIECAASPALEIFCRTSRKGISAVTASLSGGFTGLPPLAPCVGMLRDATILLLTFAKANGLGQLWGNTSRHS